MDEAPTDLVGDTPPVLGVVIVSYNTRDLVAACLRSLRTEIDACGVSAEVWVVDNASEDGTTELLTREFPWVRLVASERNLGFAAANNVALYRWIGGAAPCPRWVLLLNPDTEVRPGAIRGLVAALAADPAAALAGPALVYPDGRFQHAAFRFPGLIQTALDLWPFDRLADSVVNGRYPRSAYDRGRPFPVDLVLGACMMVRGDAIQQIGALDDGYFMYCEEVDWCRRFGAAGWRVLCVPAATVVHHGGASSGQARIPSFAALWRSRRRYFARWAPAWKRAIIDALIRVKLARMANRDRRAAERGDIATGEAADRSAAYRDILAAPDPDTGKNRPSIIPPPPTTGRSLVEAPATPRESVEAPAPPHTSSPASGGGPPRGAGREAGGGVPAGLVTAVVLTLDEAVHLPDCLASLRWADRVVVLDSGSTDGTVDIARAAGATVVRHPFENYARQRQFALGLVATPWVLFVDADERVPAALAAEVRAVVGVEAGTAIGKETRKEIGTEIGQQTGTATRASIASTDVEASAPPAAYWIPRRNLFWGHALCGGGWWPDRQLRLMKVDRARYDPDQAVHEVALVDGEAATLAEPMVHLNYASWAEFRDKQMAYARFEAQRRVARGDVVRAHNLVVQPLRELRRRFVDLGGWRDGQLGARLCAWMAWVELRTLWMVRRGR